MADAELSAEPRAAGRRIEVITGLVRRRGWSAEEKERIVTESYAGLDTVSRIARRNGLLPQQLFTWRREAKKRGAVQPIGPMSFAPVMIRNTEAGVPICAAGALINLYRAILESYHTQARLQKTAGPAAALRLC
jgi:transposase